MSALGVLLGVLGFHMPSASTALLALGAGVLHLIASYFYYAALAPWSIGEGYVNYASEMPSDAPDTPRMQRLRRVKRDYDPENRFRFNHNIEPA